MSVDDTRYPDCTYLLQRMEDEGIDLRPLTSISRHALRAFAHLLPMWNKGDGRHNPAAAAAMKALLRPLDPRLPPIFRAAAIIDLGKDAADRLWPQIAPKENG